MLSVLAVATTKRCRHDQLRPLHEVVDPEAVDLLVRNTDGTCVEFEYEGYHVAIDSEQVRLNEPNSPG